MKLDTLIGAMVVQTPEDGQLAAILMQAGCRIVPMERHPDPEADAIVISSSAATAGLIRMWRKSGCDRPLLVICGSHDEDSEFLNSGADACISGPVTPERLLSHLHAIIRRTQARTESLIRIGNLELNELQKCVRIGGREVTLTPYEYLIMEILARCTGQWISVNEMLWKIYRGENEPDYAVSVVRGNICHIRKKLHMHNSTASIFTRFGVGYSLRKKEDRPHFRTDRGIDVVAIRSFRQAAS